MSSNGSNNGQPSNDDTFVAFAFGLVSMLLIILYIPWLWGLTSSILGKFSSARKQQRDENNSIDQLKKSIIAVPRFILFVLTNPGTLIAGAKALAALPALAKGLYIPKFLRAIFRPKILVLWLWFLLLSMMMYTSFTFDAHGVLGLPADASLSDVKKAYRKLSKQYHPDQNSTETAKVLYHQVRRAYKALVNKDEFEEEARNEDYSVGVALPSFLTNKDNEYFVLFGMLALMLAIPITLFLRFRDSEKQLPTIVDKFKAEQEHLPKFFELLNIPKDRKYVEKKLSRKAILAAVTSNKLAPSNATEASISGFPLFPAFVQKLQNPAPHMGYLKSLNFDDGAIKIMSEWANEKGQAAVDAYEAEIKAICGEEDATPTITTNAATYKAVRYLMEVHMEKMNDLVDELQKQLPGEVRAVRKILSTYDDMYELMGLVFERENPSARQVQGLADIPRQLDEAFEELVPDIEKTMRKYYRQYYEQQVGKKAMKQMQRASTRGAPMGQPPM